MASSGSDQSNPGDDGKLPSDPEHVTQIPTAKAEQETAPPPLDSAASAVPQASITSSSVATDPARTPSASDHDEAKPAAAESPLSASPNSHGTSAGLPPSTPPNPPATTPPGPPNPPLSRSDVVYLIIGVGLGLVLVLMSLIPDLMGQSVRYHAALMFCGLGLCLGALGSTATVKYKGAVITGAAALALVLSWAFAANTERVVMGIIEGSRGAKEVIMLAPKSLFIARERDTEDYTFVAYERELNSKYITLRLAFSNGTPEFRCISRSALYEALGSPDRLLWQFDRDGGRLTDLSSGKSVAQTSESICGIKTVATNAIHVASALWSLLAPQLAYAQQPAMTGLAGLISDDLNQRVSTRNTISLNLDGVAVRAQLAILKSVPPVKIVVRSYMMES